MLVDHLERSLRLGPRAEKDGRPRQRAIIARFRSERLRYAVFKARFTLKAHNAEHRKDRIFINEDLTGRRAMLAHSTRTLKKDNKIVNCWTTNGNVMIKDLTNKIQQVRSDTDLAIYK